MSDYWELKEKGIRKVLTLNSVRCLECNEVSDDFPELDCGDEIKIEDFKITKVKGERFK